MSARRLRQVSTETGYLGGRWLRDCPFCFEELHFEGMIDCAVEIDDDDDGSDLSSVCCLNCGATGPMVEGGLDGAVTAWNLRGRAPCAGGGSGGGAASGGH